MRLWTVVTNYIKSTLLTTQGDIITRGAAVNQRLGTSVNGAFLMAQGAGADLTWSYVQTLAELGGAVFQVTVKDIGVWDLDATTTVSIPHGLTGTKIIGVLGVIYNDASTHFYQVCSQTFNTNTDLYLGPGAGASNEASWDATNIHITRRFGGYFDSVAFNDAVMNRGKLLIIHLI